MGSGAQLRCLKVSATDVHNSERGSNSTLFFLLAFHYNKPMLTPEEVKKVALLARIELSDAEVGKFQKDLSSVLDYVEELKAVDTDGLDIVSSVTGLENVERPDKAEPVSYQEDIMANAPERKDRYYKVKSIL